MGKRLDRFLGRGFKTKKFKTTVNLAISRLAVIKNQHQARYSVARSDVKELLNLGQQERALLLRVEQVIKEQNMLDVFDLIETYCYLLKERVDLLEQAHECPEELIEAICSMIYASSRCGGFPELQQLRSVYKKSFGNEFVARAIELRNNCGVNSKIIQKLSTRTPKYENRLKVLKEIASENNIVLHLDEEDLPEETPRESVSGVNTERDEIFTYSMKTGRKYKDVADAAQAAFESAAYAATAAKAVMEFSRDDPKSPSQQPRKIDFTGYKLKTIDKKDSSVESENLDPLQNYYYKSENNKDLEKSEKDVASKNLDPLQNYYYKESTQEDFEKSEKDVTSENLDPLQNYYYKESKQEDSDNSEKDALDETSLAIISTDSADNFVTETNNEGEIVAFDKNDDETENSLHTREGLSSKKDGDEKSDEVEESKVKIVE